MLKFLEEHTESSLKWEEPILLQNLVANLLFHPELIK